MDSQQILILVIVVLSLINLILSSIALSKTGSKSNYRQDERRQIRMRHPRGGRRSLQ